MKKAADNIEKICAMCEHAEKIFDDENVLCEKKGIVSGTYHCRKFTYDILKHVPVRAPKIEPLVYVDIDDIDDSEETGADP